MKKAVFVISGLKGGGAEKVVLNLYRCLEKYQSFECNIIAIENTVQHDITGFRVHFVSEFCNVSKKGWRRLSYKRNIARAIDEYIVNNIGDDVLIFSNMLLADKIMSKSKLNVFHIIHSPYSDVFLKGKSIFERKIIINKVNSWYKKHPLIFVSEYAKKSFITSFKTSKKSFVINNPVIINMNNIDEKVDIHGDFIVHVGRFNREKRHDRLIEIFSKVKNSDIKLLLIGDGKLKNEIEKNIVKNNLQDKVVIIGFKTNPYNYIKKSKGLVLTSDFEGLSMVLLEAIELGVPVLSTDCSEAIRDVVINNKNSLVSIGDNDSFAKKIDEMIDYPQKFISKPQDIFHERYVANKYGALIEYDHKG